MEKKINTTPLSTDVSMLDEWQQITNFANLQAWYNTHEADKSFTYKEAQADQFVLLRDFFLTKEKGFKGEVISEHTSKSIKLPVCHFWNGTMDIIIRGNFHNWIITVNSNTPVNLPNSFISSFGISKEKINSCYCEGFKEEWIYNSYSDVQNFNKMEFTVDIPYTNEAFYIFFYLLFNQSILKK